MKTKFFFTKTESLKEYVRRDLKNIWEIPIDLLKFLGVMAYYNPNTDVIGVNLYAVSYMENGLNSFWFEDDAERIVFLLEHEHLHHAIEQVKRKEDRNRSWASSKLHRFRYLLGEEATVRKIQKRSQKYRRKDYWFIADLF